MHCLLDKVTARYATQGLLKLAENRSLTVEEMFSLDLLSRAALEGIRLFISPSSANILKKLGVLPRYSTIINIFSDQTEIALPSRYFKRWARRLRDVGFTREDSSVLALASFGTDINAAILGMNFIATFDQPMINHWSVEQASIQKRFTAMKNEIPSPYCHASLPGVLRPEQINV